MSVFRPWIFSIPLMLAASTAHAGNSCESVLCMVGKLQGQDGGADCAGPVADYFNIVAFGKHGSFSPSKTANARLNYLNSCPAPGIGDWPSRINATYGMVRY